MKVFKVFQELIFLKEGWGSLASALLLSSATGVPSSKDRRRQTGGGILISLLSCRRLAGVPQICGRSYMKSSV
jgi:hypothetical protein